MIEKVEEYAFNGCHSLRGIKLPGVKIVERGAFHDCFGLEEIEFGDKLETIGHGAFESSSQQKIKMPSVRFIEEWAFLDCEQLTELEFRDIERIGQFAFNGCRRLRRMPSH